MSSSECAHFPHDHGKVVDKLKSRVASYRQHAQDCQARDAATRQRHADHDRINTAVLLQKTQESKAKKPGKYKPDPVRNKQLSDQSIDGRSDSSDVNVRLKRKLESNAVCPNGALVKPGINGCDSSVTPSGNMPEFMNGRHYDCNNANQEFGAKKMKMDANQGFNSNPGHQGPGNPNCNAGTRLSVQIVQQFGNEQQPLIETTVKVNTSINSNMRNAGADEQSVSVNVGSKDIKQESQDSNYVNQSTFVNTNMNVSTNHTEQQSEARMGDGGIGDLLGGDIGDTDLEDWLEQLTQSSSGPIGMDDFGLASQDTQQHQQQGATSQPQRQQDNQMSHEAPHRDEHSNNGVGKVPKGDTFQCKTEKDDFMGFGTEPNNNRPKSHGMFNSSDTQTQNAAFLGPNVPGCDAAKSSFNSGQPVHQQPIANSSGNNNMTSQHIQKLHVSVNSQFHVMSDKQQQQPPQRSMQQPNAQSAHHPVPNIIDKMPPRLSHPPPSNITKSMSPSSVSYSVSHQPHPGVGSVIPNGEPTVPSSYYGSVPPKQMGGQPAGPGVGLSMKPPRMQMPVTTSNISPHFNNTLHRMNSMNPGLANQGMSGAPMSRAQQLKELAHKTQQQRIPGMNGQWNVNSSASMNMSSSMTFNGQSMNQQQHMSADMQSYAAYHGPAPVINTAPNPSSVPSSNFNAASAAAEQAAQYARNQQQQQQQQQQQHQQQQQNLHNAARLSHYSTDGPFTGNQMPPSGVMPTKPVHPNAGGMTHSKMQTPMMKTQMMRTKQTRPMRPNVGMATVGDSNFCQRPSVDVSYRQQPGMPTGAGGAMMSTSASMNMRMQQTSAISNNQQRQMVQQKYMMNQYQMGSKPTVSSPPIGAPLYRGPSPLSRQGLPHHMHEIHRQPQIIQSSRTMLNNNDGMQTHSASPGWNSNPSANPGAMTQSSVPLWNREMRTQMMNNPNKMPSSVGMNGNPNHVTGMPGGYQTMVGGHQRVAMGSSMSMPGPPSHLSQNTMNHNQVVGAMQQQHHHQMMSAGMNGASQQRSNMFSPGMLQSNNAGPSLSDQGYPSQMPGHEQANGYNEHMYPMLNSPNGELNLIDELLDGK